MRPVTIRQADRNDLYRVAAFLDNCWREAYRHIVSEDFINAMKTDDRHKRLLKRYDEGASTFLVMEDGNDLIGAAEFGKPYTEGFPEDGGITAVYLRGDYIGKGYGHRLFAEIEQTLMLDGYPYFVLDVLTQNTRALEFYLKHGYKPAAERKLRLGDKEYHLTVLRKKNPLTIAKADIYLEKLPAFLAEDRYVDFSAPDIQEKAAELFGGLTDNIQTARRAFEFVRDEIPHSFDINASVVTARASDVLKHKTGICHAKANLLAALLRSQGIPAGFCFSRLTLADDDSKGYCVHCCNAVRLNGRWIKLDARGNKPGVNARFSLGEPVLAFPPRAEYDEYDYPGIYAEPHFETMIMLDLADSLAFVFDNIPDEVTAPPDIEETLQ